jgi:hypothetical protein
MTKSPGRFETVAKSNSRCSSVAGVAGVAGVAPPHGLKGTTIGGYGWLSARFPSGTWWHTAMPSAFSFVKMDPSEIGGGDSCRALLRLGAIFFSMSVPRLSTYPTNVISSLASPELPQGHP